MWFIFVNYYILVSFKSWCSAPWGWRDAETCRSDIRLHLYISKKHLLVPRMYSLFLRCVLEMCCTVSDIFSIARLKPDGTRWRTGKWRGNWRMEWVASTLTLPRNVAYPALLTLMRTSRLPAVDWTDAPADLIGLVRFGERRNLVSARVPSGFKRALCATILELTMLPSSSIVCDYTTRHI